MSTTAAAFAPAVGAVLCGGASRRMGRDKALVEVDGRPMAARVADALRDGGCGRVLAVGGDAAALGALGARLEPVGDRWPGEGPLGGLATALAAAVAPPEPSRTGSVVVLAPCDWLDPDRSVVGELLAGLAGAPRATVAVAVTEGRRHWLHAAWRASSGLAGRAEGLVASGARRLDAAGRLVRGPEAVVEVVVGASLADADSPADLPGPGAQRR